MIRLFSQMNLNQDNCRQLTILKDSIYFSGTISLTQHFSVIISLGKILKRVSEIIFPSEANVFIDNYRSSFYLFFSQNSLNSLV